ncbi:MAG TPA: glycosyltransferase family 87 protein [Stellaceae bacterium]
MLLAFLRDARWVTGTRIRDYSSMAVAGYCCMAMIWAWAELRASNPAGRPSGTDFISFWTVSIALQRGQIDTVYRTDNLSALEHAFFNVHDGFYPWAYPPIALLIVYSLAWLPYYWSLAAWLAVSLGGYLTALWRILPRPLTLWAGFAFPAVFVTMGHGQNALLSTALLGWALVLLPRRPMSAGALIGVLTYKPQLGILIPVALACGGHWRAMAAATLTALGLAAVTVALFGAEVWSDFLASTGFTRALLEEGLVAYHKMQSVFAATRLLGGSVGLAYGLQTIATLAAAAATAWVWRLPVEQSLKSAVLVTAGLLAAPFVLDYDQTLLALPIAWIAREHIRGIALPWEKSLLVVACLTPLAARPLAYFTGVGISPVVEAALLLMLLARCRLAQPVPLYQPI